MCKILSIEKKIEQKKLLSTKHISKKLNQSCKNDTIKTNLNYIFDEINTDSKNEKLITVNNNTIINNHESVICKREKSRLAAKKRRNQENDNLSELYISLPVATQSKLLSCYDSQLIGNFEKATIIKISAYVLKLYNCLSNVLFDNTYEIDRHPLVSLFSQSIFGLFWCEKTSKLIFSSPGLAKLTGLYWCNMIGMPHNSIIVESIDHNSSNIMFLRFMMGALKDKGIFTVNPKKSESDSQSSEESKPSLNSNNQTKQDFIGKLPCTVWCSQKLSNGIIFNLIQPLIIKPLTTPERKEDTQSYLCNPLRLPIMNNVKNNNEKRTAHKFVSNHYLDSLSTISVYGDYQNCLGYLEENLYKSSLFSFFHCDDIIQVMKHVNELLSGRKKLQMGMARLCTPKPNIYRWTRYILQINSIKDVTDSNCKTHRSSVSQGESYSQNYVRLSNTLGNEDLKNCETDVKNSWLEATFSLCHYDKVENVEFATISGKGVNSIKKVTENSCTKSCDVFPLQNARNAFMSSHNDFYEDCNWFNRSSTQIDMPVDLMSFTTINNQIPYYSDNYQTDDSILLKELTRPIQNY